MRVVRADGRVEHAHEEEGQRERHGEHEALLAGLGRRHVEPRHGRRDDEQREARDRERDAGLRQRRDVVDARVRVRAARLGAADDGEDDADEHEQLRVE